VGNEGAFLLAKKREKKKRRRDILAREATAYEKGDKKKNGSSCWGKEKAEARRKCDKNTLYKR